LITFDGARVLARPQQLAAGARGRRLWRVHPALQIHQRLGDLPQPAIEE
jgi:hypothetical protein